MRMSACSASKFRAVSLSVSPLVRLELIAEMLITSALNRNAANSNEVRVRVLGSTKKFTSVFPRSAGTFLISRVPTCLKASVVSRTKLISSADKSRKPSKSFRVQRAVMRFSGERARLACWRARARDRGLLFEVHKSDQVRREANARHVRYPQIARSY